MLGLRIKHGVVLGFLGTAFLGAGSPLRAQQDRKAPTSSETKTAAARAEDEAERRFRSRDALTAYYELKRRELERRWIADLGGLAARQTGSEAEATYQELFQVAIDRDAYEAAEKAAEDYLRASRNDPPMQPLATLIQAVARAGRGEDAQAMADFERFLRTASADRTISPEMAITVGEAFLQRLILFGHFETARKANALLVRAFTAPRVGKHFAARAAGLAMLGKPAPPIEGVDIQSQPIRMADFKGKVVLIEFWSVISPASAAEMSHLNSLAELYGEKGFAVLGVNLDVLREGPGAVEIVRRFLAERGVDWPSVINPRSARDAKLAFGVTEVPARFLVDRDGKIINVELTAAELDKVVPKAVEAKAVKAPAPADRR